MSEAPAETTQAKTEPEFQAPDAALAPPVLEIPKGAKWTVLAEMPWERDCCAGLQISYEAARYVYIRMREPRSINRLKRGLKFLGFVMVQRGILNNWCYEGAWHRDARIYDMGAHSLGDLRRQVRLLRDATLGAVLDQLNDARVMALEAPVIREALEQAAKKGDITAILGGVESITKQIALLTGDPIATAPAQQHHHLHAHLGADGGAPAGEGGQIAMPGAGPLARVLASLDGAADAKRAKGVNGAVVNGKAKEVRG